MLWVPGGSHGKSACWHHSYTLPVDTDKGHTHVTVQYQNPQLSYGTVLQYVTRTVL